MLEHIETVGAVERTLDGTFEHVVPLDLDRPAVRCARARVLHKRGVEVNGCQRLDFLAHNPAEEGIATADLESVSASIEHLGDKLVAGKCECQPLGIIEVGPARDESEPLETPRPDELNSRLILRLALRASRHALHLLDPTSKAERTIENHRPVPVRVRPVRTRRSLSTMVAIPSSSGVSARVGKAIWSSVVSKARCFTGMRRGSRSSTILRPHTRLTSSVKDAKE